MEKHKNKNVLEQYFQNAREERDLTKELYSGKINEVYELGNIINEKVCGADSRVVDDLYKNLSIIIRDYLRIYVSENSK